MSTYVLDVPSVMITDECFVGHLTIDMLSDDILVYIFNLFRRESKNADGMWPWHALVHVCQRWRHVIFAWPHHLDLQLYCGSGRAVARAQDIWPANLLINIRIDLDLEYDASTISALEPRNRIAGIDLSGLTKLQLQRCTAVMQEPFPILRALFLGCDENVTPVITHTFLGGSAPRLQTIHLCFVPFPTLPKLLLSATELVKLNLERITRAGYISPDALATCMSMLKRLEYVSISFQFPNSFPNLTNRHPPPLTRAVLPALETFVFEGLSEYSEDLISRIDTPLLSYFSLRFFYQHNFDIPQVPQFLNRIKNFKPPLKAEIDFFGFTIGASLVSPGCKFLFQFQCTGLDRQLLLLERIYTQCLPHTSHVNHLKLNREYTSEPRQDTALWLEFLHIFNAVEILDVTNNELDVDIAWVLGELTAERAAEVLPMLYTVVFHAQVKPLVTHILRPFIDARKLSDHPVAVSWMPQ